MREVEMKCGLCIPEKPCRSLGCPDDWPMTEIRDLKTKLTQAHERINKLRAGLEFYAETRNWEYKSHYNRYTSIDASDWHTPWHEDKYGGKCALSALKQDDEDLK